MGLFETIPEIKPKKKDGPLLGALAYLPFVSIIIPLIIYLITKEDKYTRFHALNAIGFQLIMAVIIGILFILAFMAPIVLTLITWVVSIIVMVLGFVIPTDGILGVVYIFITFAVMGVSWIIGLFSIVFWIFPIAVIFCSFLLSFYFMYLAHQGKAFTIPIITNVVRGHI